jgi:hypothetical protein
MPVGRMLAGMSNRELTEWAAYAAVEPFGEEQADRRAALICAVLEAVNTEKGKRPKHGVDGFLKLLRPEGTRPARDPEGQSPDALRAGMLKLASRGTKRTANPKRRGEAPPAAAATE